MKVEELRQIVGETKIFTVEFIKKDNTLRVMNCRLGVKKHLRGGELPYDAKAKNLLPVFDLQKGEYRIINVDTLKKVTFEGKDIYIKGI